MAFSGTVKSYVAKQGWGFITCDGVDIFVHAKDVNGANLVQGDTVTFDLGDSPTKPGLQTAINVTGVGGSAPQMGVLGSGSCTGIVKSFVSKRGYGFIDYEGRDIFVHVADCKGGRPQKGDTVAFDIVESKMRPGTLTAANVTGGSAPLHDPDAQDEKGAKGYEGGGKGCGKLVEHGGYGPMWGMKGGWCGDMSDRGGPYSCGYGGYDGGSDWGYDGDYWGKGGCYAGKDLWSAMEKGMQIGFEKGMAKGIAKGMAQAQTMVTKGGMGCGYMNGMGPCGGMHNMQRMGGVECMWGDTGMNATANAGTSNWAMPSIAGVAPPDMVSSRSAYESNPAITDAPVSGASAMASIAISHTAAIGNASH